MKAEIGLFSIAILLLLHVAASHSLVRGFRRRRRGHKGHKCLHGVNGICGDPATCTNGKLARGHCKGGASNICCVPSKNVEVKEKRRLEKDVGEIGGACMQRPWCDQPLGQPVPCTLHGALACEV